MSGRSLRRLVGSPFVAFASFGAFWGVWGASVPRVRDQAGVSDGQLGFALLFVAAGALPAMLLTGKALDRWGVAVASAAVGALGVAGAAMALAASDLPSLCAGLTLIGATSGAADVAINAVAGRAEEDAARPIITRAHGVFSTLVVLGSLGTGLAAAARLPLVVPFMLVAVLSLIAAASLLTTLPDDAAARARDRPESVDRATFGRSEIAPMLLIGVLGALAFASENAHQSWSAVFAHDELDAGVGLSAGAPGVFAGVVAIARFSIGGFPAVHARTVLLAGAAVAAVGTVVLAVAPVLAVAALGLALAAAGTGVLFPTLVGIVSRNVDESLRGRAMSVVTTVSYLGFLFSPVYVGLWADAVGLRGAMVAVATLAVVLFFLTPALLQLSGYRVRNRDRTEVSTRGRAVHPGATTS